MVDLETVKFIGTLNRLADAYKSYGIKSLSEVREYEKDGRYYWGLVYDDSKDESNGFWHRYPLLNGMDGKTYNDMFSSFKFEVAWNNDDVPKDDPDIWVYLKDKADECTCHIEKDGWYF